jgi:hydroxyacylglutathione hydrolase
LAPTTPKLHVATIVSAPFDENSYIARFEGRTDCLIFDPGFDPEAIIEHVDEAGLLPAALMITHGHSDHIAGNAALKKHWPAAPLVIGRGDAPKLTDAALNLSAAYGISLVSPPADVLVDEGETYRAAGFELEVLEIPGHSSGHVVFVWRGARPWIVFGGDVLFRGSVGRTDFPDGSFEDLATGIHRKLFTLPDDTVVLSGHGEPTTIGEEKLHNPFVGRAAGRRA